MKPFAPVLALALLVGCGSTGDPFWIENGITLPDGSRGDLHVRAWSPPDSGVLLVEVVEHARVEPGAACRVSFAELEHALPDDFAARLANIPAGAGMIALVPLAIPAGIGLRIAGVDDIGHCDTLLLPLVFLVGGGMHLVPVAGPQSAYLFHPESGTEVTRRTGREEVRTLTADSGGVLDGLIASELPEPEPWPALPRRWSSPGSFAFPRQGVRVRLLKPASAEEETGLTGVVAFGLPEDLHPRSEVEVGIELDGEIHVCRFERVPATCPEPVVIERGSRR